MFGSLLLSGALALGQVPPPDLGTAKGEHRPSPAADVLTLDAAETTPQPTEPSDGASFPSSLFEQTAGFADEAPKAQHHEIEAPLMPPPKTAEVTASAAPAATPPDRWALARAYQGTGLGHFLDGERMAVYGWLAPSYNFSSAAQNNVPVTWNDRANEFLFQQVWGRVERTVVTSGTATPTWGFRVDLLYGTDYRYTLQRNLMNGQLLNADGVQNLYGFDFPDAYVNVFVPTWFQGGTEFRVGRQYTPFGQESLEAPTTPLMSRSYAFNWSPPFTHNGITMINNFSPQWQLFSMLANGNDVWLDQTVQEARYVGRLQWTSKDKQDIVAYGMSVGRGKFNAGKPFAPSTFATANEPAGRNNINVFDICWNHTFNPRMSYAFECIFGYQYGVPLGSIPEERGDDTNGHATVRWGSLVHYLFYNFNPGVGSILRVETFDDFQGQRTGFEGLYTEVTAGMQFKMKRQASGVPQIVFRPEVRWDYNGYSQPFEGNKNWLVTAGADLIIRW